MNSYINPKRKGTTMNENRNFLEELAEMSKLEPKDFFSGFHDRFEQIEKMDGTELMITKQAFDLTLKLTNKALGHEHEIIIIALIKAMQVQVQNRLPFHCPAERQQMKQIFYITDNGCLLDFHYDYTCKQIIAIPSVPIVRKKILGLF